MHCSTFGWNSAFLASDPNYDTDAPPFGVRGFTLCKGGSPEKALRMLVKKHNDGNDGKENFHTS